MTVFDEWVQKGREFIHEFEKEAGLEIHKDDQKAFRIIRAILKTIRDRLTPQETIDFASPLPMVLKAVIIDGWKLSSVPDKSIKTKVDLLERIMTDSSLKNEDIRSLEEAERYFKAFVRVIMKYEQGELADVVAQLPSDIKELFC